jgi:small subunit ribosomal protein S20
MAHHKSALKRMRQSEKKRIYNRQKRKGMKLSFRAVNEAKSFDQAQLELVKAFSVLDKAAAKGVIHKNTAAHKKSSLYKTIMKLKTVAA